jgi:hypothetical protein
MSIIMTDSASLVIDGPIDPRELVFAFQNVIDNPGGSSNKPPKPTVNNCWYVVDRQIGTPVSPAKKGFVKPP